MASSRFTHKQTLSKPPSYLLGLIYIVFQLAIIGITWTQLPPQLPLLYSLPYGFGRLINKVIIFLVPGISLLVWLIGLGFDTVPISSSIYRHIKFWMIQLVLFLHTIALVHSILIVL